MATHRREERDQTLAVWRARDAQRNDETRLPSGEGVSCAGMMLLEVVTPSTLATFQRRITALPGERAGRPRVVEGLEKARTNGGGWTSLGYLRPPGSFVMGGGGNDPSLPSSVEAVWLSLHYPLPSLAVLVATFTFKEEAGELDDLLRRDYSTSLADVRVNAYGRIGRLTRWLPWARPLVGVGYSIIDPSRAKSRAVEALLAEREAECRAWLNRTLPGRFALEAAEQPGVVMLVTEDARPFKDHCPAFEPLGIGLPALDAWAALRGNGWMGTFRAPLGQRRGRATWAVRRSDLPGSRDSRSDDEARANWHVTQRFHEEEGPLFVAWGIWRLLGLYEKDLARFRDSRAHRRRRGRVRPIQEARALDALLTGDGMDAAVVCHDIVRYLESHDSFRLFAPDYEESLAGIHRVPLQERPPRQLLAVIHRELLDGAKELPRRAEVTLANVRASAELRQAMANTRLQRILLPISVAALIVAGIGLVRTAGGDDSPPGPAQPSPARVMQPKPLESRGPAPKSSRSPESTAPTESSSKGGIARR